MADMKKAAAWLLAMALLMAPMAAFAAETAPLASGAMGEDSVPGVQTIDPCLEKETWRGVTTSDDWLWQGRVGGMMIDLRLFTPQGDSVTFRESLSDAASGSGVRLALRASQWESDLLLQFDQRVMDILERVGITEIVVADPQYNIRAAYKLSDVQAIRDFFELGEREQLCLGGENHPVTVISEDGVRRTITK